MRRRKRVPLEYPEGLPEICYATLPHSGKLVVLKRGVRSFSMFSHQSSSAAKNRKTAKEENELLGINKAQEAAMKYGTRFGFGHPEADPKNYDKRGNLLPVYSEPDKGTIEIRER